MTDTNNNTLSYMHVLSDLRDLVLRQQVYTDTLLRQVVREHAERCRLRPAATDHVYHHIGALLNHMTWALWRRYQMHEVKEEERLLAVIDAAMGVITYLDRMHTAAWYSPGGDLTTT